MFMYSMLQVEYVFMLNVMHYTCTLYVHVDVFLCIMHNMHNMYNVCTCMFVYMYMYMYVQCAEAACS